MRGEDEGEGEQQMEIMETNEEMEEERTRMARKSVAEMPSAISNSPRSFARVTPSSNDEVNILRADETR